MGYHFKWNALLKLGPNVMGFVEGVGCLETELRIVGNSIKPIYSPTQEVFTPHIFLPHSSGIQPFE